MLGAQVPLLLLHVARALLLRPHHDGDDDDDDDDADADNTKFLLFFRYFLSPPPRSFDGVTDGVTTLPGLSSADETENEKEGGLLLLRQLRRGRILSSFPVIHSSMILYSTFYGCKVTFFMAFWLPVTTSLIMMGLMQEARSSEVAPSSPSPCHHPPIFVDSNDPHRQPRGYSSMGHRYHQVPAMV